jgi:iron complex outermembrane recepter protein
MGPWAAGLVNHYKSGYLDQDGTSEVGAYSTWDLYGSWSPNKQFTLTAGVRNLFDKAPPSSVQAATFQVGYDPRFADPYMRTYYVRGTFKF